MDNKVKITASAHTISLPCGSERRLFCPPLEAVLRRARYKKELFISNIPMATRIPLWLGSFATHYAQPRRRYPENAYPKMAKPNRSRWTDEPPGQIVCSTEIW